MREKTVLSVLCLVAGLIGCGGNGNKGNADSGPTSPDGASGQAVSIEFAAMVGDSAANCSDTYDGIGTSGSTIAIKDMRLYVSNVRLVDDQSNEVAVTLDETDRQHSSVALLDFEDGTDGCADTGTTDTNTTLTGTVPAGSYSGIKFDVGLPFEMDHLDVGSAPAPLNVAAMFWAWSKGYKFTRINIVADPATDALPYHMHLGSTMCDTTGATPPNSECAHPNRPTISLSGFDPASDTVVFDIGALFADSDLTADAAMSPPGCHSGMPDAAECTPIFPTLGLDFSSGDCTNDCADQTVLKVQ